MVAGAPERNERPVLDVSGVLIKEIPYRIVLTPARIYLVRQSDRKTNEVAIPDIESAWPETDAVGGPAAALQVHTAHGRVKTLLLHFSRAGTADPHAERDRWVQEISRLLPPSSRTPGQAPVPAPAAPAAGPIPPGYVFCSRCGRKVLAGSDFCDRCGSRIVTPDQPAATPSAPAPLERQPAAPFTISTDTITLAPVTDRYAGRGDRPEESPRYPAAERPAPEPLTISTGKISLAPGISRRGDRKISFDEPPRQRSMPEWDEPRESRFSGIVAPLRGAGSKKVLLAGGIGVVILLVLAIVLATPSGSSGDSGTSGDPIARFLSSATNVSVGNLALPNPLAGASKESTAMMSRNMESPPDEVTEEWTDDIIEEWTEEIPPE